jgi:hypothetical protein
LRNTRPARTHVRGGDEQLDRRLRQPLEVDGLGQDVAQRVGTGGIEVVGEKWREARSMANEDGGVVKRPATQEHVQRRAPQRAQLGGARHLAPEGIQSGLCPIGRARRMTIGQHGRVHGAGRGAGNAVDLEPGLLEQPIQHAPGEGAMRTPRNSSRRGPRLLYPAQCRM